MSIETVCGECGAEYDLRHGGCPVCPEAPRARVTRRRKLTADHQDAARDPEKVLAELDTPQAMLKRLQKSLKDPYPRPWRAVYDELLPLHKKLMRVVNAREESIIVLRADLARLIVKAVNAQHEARKGKR